MRSPGEKQVTGCARILRERGGESEKTPTNTRVREVTDRGRQLLEGVAKEGSVDKWWVKEKPEKIIHVLLRVRLFFSW